MQARASIFVRSRFGPRSHGYKEPPLRVSKEVTHQIVKEQDFILATSRSEASPRTNRRRKRCLMGRLNHLIQATRARGNSCHVWREGKALDPSLARTSRPSRRLN